MSARAELESFEQRVARLPHLGLGISTEFGAGRTGLDPLLLHQRRPDLVQFLEIGADLERGVDEDARRWAAARLPTTYHFLDVNLEEPETLDARWIADTAALARSLDAAWLCGDAGLWHVGARDAGHGVLMPPILEPDSASELAAAVRRLREETGFEVLPENPPAHVYLGRLHPLEYYARVLEEADCGMLLDVSHLAIAQRARRGAPLDGLGDFPLERVVEVHVAGATLFEHAGRTFVDDDHGLEVLPEVWEILEAVLERASNLRAIVLECERNPLDSVIPLYERLAAHVGSRRGASRGGDPPSGSSSAIGAPRAGARHVGARRVGARRVGARLAGRASEAPGQVCPAPALDHRRLQRTLLRMQLDATFAARVVSGDDEALASTSLGPAELALLGAADPRAIAADRDDARRWQVLGNVAREFALATAWARVALPHARLLEDFARSPELHRALASGTRLPLAFAQYAQRRAASLADPLLTALVRLESAMARARRLERDQPSPAPGELVLAARAHLLELPAGTLAHAARLRDVLDREGAHLPPAPDLPGERETILVLARRAPSPHALPEVHVEALAPAVARLLDAAREPLDPPARARLAAELAADPADLEAFADELVAEGALQRG